MKDSDDRTVESFLYHADMLRTAATLAHKIHSISGFFASRDRTVFANRLLLMNPQNVLAPLLRVYCFHLFIFSFKTFNCAGLRPLSERLQKVSALQRKSTMLKSLVEGDLIHCEEKIEQTAFNAF
jgi:hypothetical protein